MDPTLANPPGWESTEGIGGGGVVAGTDRIRWIGASESLRARTKRGRMMRRESWREAEARRRRWSWRRSPLWKQSPNKQPRWRL